MNLTLPWHLKKLGCPPTEQTTARFTEPGVRALFYEGLRWQGKATRIFAWYGTPATPDPSGRFPAMILVHGGGGTAFAEWVRLWNRRGYAASSTICRSELNVTSDAGPWQQRAWRTLPAQLNAGECRVTAEIPARTTVYYFNLYDDREVLGSSEHVEMPCKAR